MIKCLAWPWHLLEQDLKLGEKFEGPKYIVVGDLRAHALAHTLKTLLMVRVLLAVE
jgi:hypothetical protein